MAVVGKQARRAPEWTITPGAVYRKMEKTGPGRTLAHYLKRYGALGSTARVAEEAGRSTIAVNQILRKAGPAYWRAFTSLCRVRN